MAKAAFDIHEDEITFDGRTVGFITAGPSEGREALERCLFEYGLRKTVKYVWEICDAEEDDDE